MLNLRSLSVLQEKYNSLTFREQSVIKLGLTAVLVAVLILSLYVPMREERIRLETSIESKERDLMQLKNIVAQHKRLSATLPGNNGKKGSEPFILFSVLEKMAAKSGLMEKMDYMKPGSVQLDSLREEKQVELKLSRITLKELTSFLHNLQAFGRGIYIKRLSIRKDREYLNLIMQPAVVEMK